VTVEAATRACASAEIDGWEVLDHIGGLVNRSLVVVGRAGDHVRYRLLETLRAYAGDRFRERSSDEQLQACDGFVEHFVELAQRVDANGHDHSAGAWFALLDDDRANLRAVLAKAAGTPRYRARGCELAGSMAHYGRYGRERSARAARDARRQRRERRSRAAGSCAERALANALRLRRGRLGGGAARTGAADGDRSAGRETQMRDSQRPRPRVLEQGDPDRAKRRLDEAEAVARDAGDAHGCVASAPEPSIHRGALGDLDASKRLLLETLSEARPLGEPRLLMMTLLNLGWDDFALDARDSARAYLAEAIAIAGSIGDDPHRFQMHAIFTMIAVVDGDEEEATRHLG